MPPTLLASELIDYAFNEADPEPQLRRLRPQPSEEPTREPTREPAVAASSTVWCSAPVWMHAWVPRGTRGSHPPIMHLVRDQAPSRNFLSRSERSTSAGSTRTLA